MRTKWNQQLQIAETRPIILFPCRMHPQKRPFLMLEIAQQVRKEISNIAFVAVGDGPQLEELQKVCKEKQLEQTIYFAGRAEDMLPYYKDADITLICSLKEGLALTAYESLSMEVPVVSSDVGGQKELIDDTVGKIISLEQDEESDLDNREFSAHEVQAYVDAIVDILQDKERYMQLSKNCRNRIEEAFSSEIMIHKLEQIFSQAVQDKEQKQKRNNAVTTLQQVSSLVEDHVTIYGEIEILNSELHMVWESKQWLHQQYNMLLDTYRNISEEITVLNETEVELKLKEIYNMRTWKMIQKYRKFMDETWLGHQLSKVRAMILK